MEFSVSLTHTLETSQFLGLCLLQNFNDSFSFPIIRLYVFEEIGELEQNAKHNYSKIGNVASVLRLGRRRAMAGENRGTRAPFQHPRRRTVPGVRALALQKPVNHSINSVSV